MHAAKLVELAALAASHNHIFRTQTSLAQDWAAERYWCTSKVRLQRWTHHINSLQQRLKDPARDSAARLWPEVEPVLEEILLAEVCARVWCATLAVVDHHHLPGELDPIARSVLVGHLEARRRVLQLLVFGRGLKNVSAVELNRLRQACECWTDVLLTNLSPGRVARQFAFDVRRMNEVSTRGPFPVLAQGAHDRWLAQLLPMRLLLARRPWKPAVCPELNAEVGSIILSCLSPCSFDGCGTQRPGWCRDPFQTDWLATHVGTLLCGPSPWPRSGCNSDGRHPGK